MTFNTLIYVEPFSGISGDMMLGALLDLGMDFNRLRDKLRLLPVMGYHLDVQKCMRSGIRATKFDVHLDSEVPSPHHHHSPSHGSQHPHEQAHHDFSQHKEHHHRNFKDIKVMIESSELSDWVKDKSVQAFARLAEAEGKIHGKPMESVHFHEVGAIDSIVDIVGCMIAVEELLPARFICAPVNLGHGTLQCQHGTYPVPAPATQELLKGVPTFANSVEGELTTPTGATLLATLVDAFGTCPPMIIQAAGYGAGGRETPGNANVLRITKGTEFVGEAGASPDEQVTVIESTIDDMSTQVYGYFQEQALAAGALDVYATSIQMKKNRPGLMVTVVCSNQQTDEMADMLFRETTTIGIRYFQARRKTLQREFRQVQTEYGAVTIKISSLNGQKRNVSPEYEDCRRLAQEKNIALKDVIAAAVKACLEAVENPGAK